MALRKIVLDVLKPIKGTSIIDIAERISSLDGIDGVNILVTDMDVETMGLLITIEGQNIDFRKVKDILEDEGCAIHSIDEVSSGTKLVEGAKRK